LILDINAEELGKMFN